MRRLTYFVASGFALLAPGIGALVGAALGALVGTFVALVTCGLVVLHNDRCRRPPKSITKP